MIERMRVSSWTQEADLKLRSWINARREQVLGNSGQFGTAVLDPLRSFSIDADLNREQWQLRLEELSFRTKVRIGEAVYNSFVQMSRQWLGASVHEAELDAGKIRYWKTANARPETILFFHGFGDSMDGVYHLAHHLVPRYNMIVPDLPGFGKSFKRHDLSHNYESYGKWLQEFIEVAKIGPVHVVGNSLGGAFAMMLAQLRPDLVKSMTLLNTAAITDFKNRSIYDELLIGQILFQVKTKQEFEQFWQRVFHKQPFIPPFVREYLLHNFRENHDWYGHLIQQIFTDIRHRRDPRYKDLFLNQHLPKLKVPSLIIWGDQDRLFPVSFGERGHKLLRKSRFIVLEGVGHAPQVEAPGLVAKHLKNFIDGLPVQVS